MDPVLRRVWPVLALSAACVAAPFLSLSHGVTAPRRQQQATRSGGASGSLTLSAPGACGSHFTLSAHGGPGPDADPGLPHRVAWGVWCRGAGTPVERPLTALPSSRLVQPLLALAPKTSPPVAR